MAPSSPVMLTSGGLPPRRQDILLEAGQAHRQRLHRNLQRLAPGRVPELALARDHRGSASPRRSLADRLQREPASHGSWKPDPAGIRLRASFLNRMEASTAVEN